MHACGACIDACDSVMDKMGSPRGLIRYTTEQAVQGRQTRNRSAPHDRTGVAYDRCRLLWYSPLPAPRSDVIRIATPSIEKSTGMH
jgi:polyferredoxin